MFSILVLFQDFKKSSAASSSKRRRAPPERGQFEVHTKGVGRKIMERQGWKEGRGLGKTFEGAADAIEHDGQTNRFGFGYRGEAVATYEMKEREKRAHVERADVSEVLISTIYDDPAKTDTHAKGDRRNPSIFLSHRKNADAK